MNLLRGAIRNYHWGSRTAIAQLTRRSTPSRHPEAELWLGAHPGDPAALIDDGGERSLLDALRADPRPHLGHRVLSRFGPELPFLMKVLAAEQPLSLQAHPNAEQARAGFEREERVGSPLGEPVRSYTDPRPKPEMVIALDRFEAIVGFREPADTQKLLHALNFHDYACILDAPGGAETLRALFTVWISAPPAVVATEIETVLRGAADYLHTGDVEFAAEAATVMELGERYPCDPGVLISILLNRVTLQLGDALFLPAGNLHAYLRGVAVEVMANSDNVLRGGLTSKHVDVPELLSILDFTPIDPASMRPEIHRDGACLVYSPPIDEFAVSVWTLGADFLGREITALHNAYGPHIVLCTEGLVTVSGPHTSLTLQRGDAAWISDIDRPIRFNAEHPSTLFVAGVPDS